MNVFTCVYFCVYILDIKAVKKTQLENYKLTSVKVPMSPMLFRDAIDHSTSENTTHTHPHTLKWTRSAENSPDASTHNVNSTHHTPVQSIQYITTINIRGPHLLYTDVSLPC